MIPFATIRRLRRGPATPGLMAALGAGAALHIAGIALVGATWRMPAPPPDPEVFVRAEQADSVLNEQADLMDPSPAFLPTPWNFGANFARRPTADSDAPPLPAPAQPLPDPANTPIPTKPRNLLLTEAYARRPIEKQLPAGSGDTFLAYGRRPPDTAAIRPEAALCLVAEETTGKDVARLALSVEGGGPAGGALIESPVFFVEVDAYGASPPVLRQPSRDAEYDRRLAGAIAAALQKQPLRPGRYTLRANL